MRRFIVEAEDDDVSSAEDLYGMLYMNLPSFSYNVREIPEPNHRADGTPRMTFAQREKLWQLCGGYNVPFREDDYFTESTGFVMGWIGGFNHSGLPSAKEKKTIYVAVEPNGDAHS